MSTRPEYVLDASLATRSCSRRQEGFSLVDRACLTLARNLNAIAVTADQAWEGLPVRVLAIR